MNAIDAVDGGVRNHVARARLAVSAVFAMNGAGIGLWAAHIPGIQDRLRLSEGVLGLVLLTVAFGAMAAMPLMGGATSRFGTRRPTAVAAIAFAGVMSLPVLAPTVPLLFAAAFLFGACNGTLDVAMNAHASEVEKARGRPSMSSFHGFFSLGGLAGAALGGAMIAGGFGQGEGFVAAAVAALSVAALAARHLLPVRDAGADHGPHFVWPRRAALALGGLTLLCMAVEGAVADWSALYLVTVGGASAGFAAAGYAAFSLAMAACRFAGDAVVHRIGAGRMVRLGGVLIALGIGLAILLPHPVAGALGFALVGIGAANVVPVLFGAAAKVPGMAAGVGVAVVATTGYTGFLVGPPVIGFVADALGLAAALGLLALAGLVIALKGGAAARSG